VTEKHVDPETTLLSFLREKRLTGTKYGCGGGGCGACTVMVSRYRPANKSIHYSVNACLLPLCQLHGAAITTVEGIGSTKTRIHPVQERIAKAHGSQCGFCTPGMVMSMYTLLRNNPQPSLEDITQALTNLCRCTGYRPIIDGCRTFCQLPIDHTQELIFPPELIFRGERVTCVSPVLLEELVQLKTSNPEAPLIMGNTKLPDFKFKGVVHPLIISPIRVLELFEVTETTHTLGGHIMSANPNSDLNPILAAGNCGWREVPLNQEFFLSFGKTVLRPEEIVVSVLIPFSRKGELVRAFRQAPRKECAFATITTGMRVLFSEGFRVVEDVSIYFGGVGPKTAKAVQTCATIVAHVSKGQSDQDPVGRAIIHSSAISQATGEAIYCDDLPKTDGELFLSLVTSSRAHAKINVDVSDALLLPGVVDVITAKDIPGKKTRMFSGYDEEMLAVSCIGQIVCAVLADTRAHARRAASAVNISYEDLSEPIFTIEQDAIKRSSYFEPRRKLERGNVEEAFKSVDLVHEAIRIGGQEHFYMETQSILVLPVREQAEFKIYASSQSPTSVQAVSETLAIPANRVSCHVKRLGGAFGGKFVKTVILACITSVAAWTNCAVRCVLERGEDMLITGGRHPVLGKYKQVGFQKDGRILAADIQIWTNAGNAVDVAEKILLHLDNAYNIPNLRGRAAACRTNLPSNTSFRGFGVPQVACVIENLISDVQVREINMYKGPSLTHYKVEFSPENLLRCWDECKAKSDFCSRRIAVDTFNEQNRWKKRGLSIIPIKYGIAFSEGVMNQSAALVNIYQDGSVLVTHGGTEMGQGVHTKMQQVVSRELHIPMSKVYIGETSTNAVPNTFISAASFGTDANGMANACQTLYQRLEPVRQKNPKGTWESWVSAAVMEKISLSATGFSGPDSYIDWDKMEGQPFPYFTYGVCCSEVELDCLTGDYRTMRTNIVADVGQSLNPSVDIGQIEGAFMQGLGLFTMEELKFSPCGLLYTRGPSQYKIPAVCDLPLSFNIHLLSDSNNPHAIYSSKGIGEPTLFLGSSVFFAIKDAVAAARKEVGLSGPFSLDSPATAERICL
uniref:Aldehyde oxidase 1 n=1 Tax=Hippocampus comes TaxID=109280 RepID=A0A3Q2YTQ2_HIPCM